MPNPYRIATAAAGPRTCGHGSGSGLGLSMTGLPILDSCPFSALRPAQPRHSIHPKENRPSLTGFPKFLAGAERPKTPPQAFEIIKKYD